MKRSDFKNLVPHMKSDMWCGEWTTRYWVEGAAGAVEFWVRKTEQTQWSEERAYGGFEVHSCIPTDDSPPSHGRCAQLSDRPCWHDGSSLYATEYWIPLWERTRGNTDNDHSIFASLVSEYFKRFSKEESE